MTVEDQKENRKKFDQVLVKCGNLYDEKNIRYNNAFAENFRNSPKELALPVATSRLSEKMARAVYISRFPDDFGDESIVDSLMDLINYSTIVLMELER